MTPTHPLTVTLEAQQWQTVMNVLAEAPFRIAQPLIAAIQQQCMRQDEAAPDNVTQFPEVHGA